MVGADMSIKAVPSFEMLLAEVARVAWCLYVCLRVLLQVLFGVVAVATDLTAESTLG